MFDSKYKFLFIIFFLAALFWLPEKIVLAEDSQDCDELSGKAKDDCEELEKKAKAYQEIIKLKNKQQTLLSNQLESIDSEQKKTFLQIQETQKKEVSLVDQIKELERDITEAESRIGEKKIVLSDLMRNYYEYEQDGFLGIVLIGEAFSESLIQLDYLEQSGERVREILSEISRLRQELLEKKTELDEKREELNKTKENLLDKNEDLQSSESQKASLLTKTQGEEEKYKQLLVRVEAQKSELFDFSAASNTDELVSSVDDYAKPSGNLASTGWYFSQRDSRWANKKIGNSSSLMKDYGCAVSAVSMVFRKNGSNIDPGKMAKQKVFYYDLIKWPASWDPSTKLVSSVNHGNIKWSTIDSEIKNGNPVIVYIKRSRGGGHYVVVTGKDKKDYIVHDPYFGPNLYLGTSKSLVGKLGTDSKVTIDQMIIYN